MFVLITLKINSKRSPTADNLIPIRLDIEIDGQRFRDAFTWNPSGSSTPFPLINLNYKDEYFLNKFGSKNRIYLNECAQIRKKGIPLLAAIFPL